MSAGGSIGKVWVAVLYAQAIPFLTLPENRLLGAITSFSFLFAFSLIRG